MSPGALNREIAPRIRAYKYAPMDLRSVRESPSPPPINHRGFIPRELKVPIKPPAKSDRGKFARKKKERVGEKGARKSAARSLARYARLRAAVLLQDSIANSFPSLVALFLSRCVNIKPDETRTRRCDCVFVRCIAFGRHLFLLYRRLPTFNRTIARVTSYIPPDIIMDKMRIVLACISSFCRYELMCDM